MANYSVGSTLDMTNFPLGLLANDFVFFKDGQIVCKDDGHELAGMEINAPKMNQMMPFIDERVDGFESIQEAAWYVVAYLKDLEKDKALRVPASRISPAIRKGLPGGYLSGITLANFCACDRALVVDSVQRDDEAYDMYRVLYDTRLALGIPSFFDLCARMIWDLRQASFSAKGKPFVISFEGVRSFNNSYFDDVRKPVKGAQVCPNGVYIVTELPQIGTYEEASESGIQTEDENLQELIELANASGDPLLARIVDEVAGRSANAFTKSKTSSNQCEQQAKTKSKTSSDQCDEQTKKERERQEKLEQKKLEQEERKRQKKLERICARLPLLESKHKLQEELRELEKQLAAERQKIKEKKDELSELTEKHAKASSELTELQNQKAALSQQLGETGIFALKDRHQLKSTVTDLERRIARLKEVKANYAASISHAEEYLDSQKALSTQRDDICKRLSTCRKRELTLPEAALLVEEVFKDWGGFTYWNIDHWKDYAYDSDENKIPYISDLGFSGPSVIEFLKSQNKIEHTGYWPASHRATYRFI